MSVMSASIRESRYWSLDDPVREARGVEQLAPLGQGV